MSEEKGKYHIRKLKDEKTATPLETAEKKIKKGKYSHLEARETKAIREELKRLRAIEREQERERAFAEEITEAIKWGKEK